MVKLGDFPRLRRCEYDGEVYYGGFGTATH